MKLGQTMAALLLSTLVAACGNTADGVKADAEVAAEKTSEAMDATGEAVGGALQTGEIKTAIMADDRVDAGDINVDTNEPSKTVTLSGSVGTEAEKTWAGEIAASKAPGYTITNILAVRPN